MNYLKNPISSIGNSIEINSLKSKREKLETEKKELLSKCAKYDEQIEFKNNISKNIQSNQETLSELRTIFTKSNIKYDVEFEEFTKTIGDSDLIMYKKLYDQLMTTSRTFDETSNHLDKNISIKKEVYIESITNIDANIENINKKLKNVREKQFGNK